MLLCLRISHREAWATLAQKQYPPYSPQEGVTEPWLRRTPLRSAYRLLIRANQAGSTYTVETTSGNQECDDGIANGNCETAFRAPGAEVLLCLISRDESRW